MFDHLSPLPLLPVFLPAILTVVHQVLHSLWGFGGSHNILNYVLVGAHPKFIFIFRRIHQEGPGIRVHFDKVCVQLVGVTSRREDASIMLSFSYVYICTVYVFRIYYYLLNQTNHSYVFLCTYASTGGAIEVAGRRWNPTSLYKVCRSPHTGLVDSHFSSCMSKHTVSSRWEAVVESSIPPLSPYLDEYYGETLLSYCRIVLHSVWSGCTPACLVNVSYDTREYRCWSLSALNRRWFLPLL
jgi:hypothetical protein